jgi:hypothetical protein
MGPSFGIEDEMFPSINNAGPTTSSIFLTVSDASKKRRSLETIGKLGASRTDLANRC